MKRYVFLFIILTSFIKANAQSPYIPIEFHNAGFAIERSVAGTWMFENTRYEMYESDTIINTLVYSKFNGHYLCDWSTYPNCGFYPWNPTYTIYYRNDTAGRKVYSTIDPSQPIENLVCDFSLQVGDTMSSYVLNLIDSVMINNVWHRRFNFNDTVNSLDYWRNIEGVGVDAWWNFEAGEHMRCYAIGDSIIWHPNPDSNIYCYLPLSTTEISSTSNLIEYSNNTIHISSGQGKLQVYDLTGQIIFCEEVKDNYSRRIPAIAQGLYIVQFTSNKKREVKKIWVE